jgi:hypothetical protein
MSNEPTLKPTTALMMVKESGNFIYKDFLYEMDEDCMSVSAENIHTGKFWQCTGEYGVPLDKTTEWVSML